MRARIAHWWRTDPFLLRRYPAREYRVMAEMRERMVKEHNDQIEAAKHGGLPVDRPKSKSDF